MTHVSINNHDWTVAYDDPVVPVLPHNVLGRTCFDTLQIIMKRDLSEQALRLSLLHELAHAFLFSQGRVYQERFTQEDLCEFVAWNGPEIVGVAETITKELKEDQQ